MNKSVLFFPAMLVALNMMTQAQAATICVSGYVCDDRLTPPETTAPPPYTPPIAFEPSPIVLLPFQDSTGWNYGFTAPAQVQSVAMPHFSDSGIFAIGTPDGWTYAVGAPDAEGKATATWQQLPSSPMPSGIFSFKSIYSPSEANYQFSFDAGSVRNYQLFIPFSPLAQAAGYTSFTAPVPEPSAIYLITLGLVACIAATRRRRNDQLTVTRKPA